MDTDLEIVKVHMERIRSEDQYLLMAYIGSAPFPRELLPLDVDRIAKRTYGAHWKPSLSCLVAAIQAVRAAHAEQAIAELAQMPGLPRPMLELVVDEILIGYSLTIAEVATLVEQLDDRAARSIPTKPAEG